MFFNPAFTGFYSEQFRATTTFRNQWSSVSKGYNSYLLTAETHLFNSRKHRFGFGLGLSFLADVAGSLNYGSQNFGLALSFFKSMGLKSQHTFSFGLNINRSTYSYDIGNADYGSQISDYEAIPLNLLSVYDISLGCNWQSTFDNKMIFQTGFNLMHLNEPLMTYFGYSELRMPMRTNLYASLYLPSDLSYGWKPTLMLQKQTINYELLAGCEFIRHLDAFSFESKTIACGVYYRILDALILQGSYRYNGFNIGLCYEVNLSSLTPASKTYGAVEIFMSYAFGVSKSGKRSTLLPCPVF
jgi:type IX secretion system PorP/SprF family membrane protein